MSDDHEPLQPIARDWAGLTQQGRVLISVDRVKAGHPLTEIIDHERAHAVLIRDTVLGWVLNTLATFGLHPWHAGDVRDRCYALLAVLSDATRWTHEGLATFLANLRVQEDDYAEYRSRQPPLYLRAASELEWLHERGFDAPVRADIALMLGCLASAVPVLERWDADGLTDVGRARKWFAEPVHRPDARFPALCRALADLEESELVDLAAQPDAAVAVATRLIRLDGVTPEFRLLPDSATLDEIRSIVRAVTAPLLDDPTLSQAGRDQLAGAVRVPELALQGLSPAGTSMLMTRTRGDVGRFLRDPAPQDLVGYDLVRIQYNVSFDIEPGLTPSGAEPLPLLPREAVCYFSAAGRRSLAATFSAFAFLDWLDALDDSLTISVVDTSYLTLGTLMPPLPVLAARRHVVLVTGRTPYALVLDVASSAPTDALTLITVNASDLVGVSYVMLRQDGSPSPVIILPTVAEAARETVERLVGSDASGPSFRMVGPEQFFRSQEELRDVMRVIADFEGTDDPLPAARPPG